MLVSNRRGVKVDGVRYDVGETIATPVRQNIRHYLARGYILEREDGVVSDEALRRLQHERGLAGPEPEPAPAAVSDADYSAKTKAELMDELEDAGVPFKIKATKAELIALLGG